MNIILGSKSSGRKSILAKMGYNFTVLDPDINEKSIRNKNPIKLVKALAYAKADALLPKIKSPSILITADQVVYCNKKIIEKPKDKKEADFFLQLYAKHPTKTIAAILLTNTVTKKQACGIDVSTIWIKKIPKNIVKKLLSQEYLLKCAGGFSINDPLFYRYVSKIEGTTDSITGLPIKLTNELIKKVSA